MPDAPTHCGYCAMQCAMTLSEQPDGTLSTTGRAHPINEGRLCVLGQSSPKLFGHPERLQVPLVRQGGRLEPATWDEALDAAAAGFLALRERYGNDVNACYSGASVSNEKAYLIGKFARLVLKTRHVDYNGRYCMSAAASGALRAFGLDRGLNMPLGDLATHDLIVIVGSNIAETLPVMIHALLAAKKSGTRFIVIDPRKTTTANLAELHLPVRLGGDLALANALLKTVLDDHAQNDAFIAARTDGFDEMVRALQATSYADLVYASGLSHAQIADAAGLLEGAERPLIVTGRGNDQNVRGVDSTLAFINLALALGAAYGTLTGQANGQGAREHGLKADQLPGYRLIADEQARHDIAKVWNIDPNELPGPGYSAYEMLQALGRQEIRGLFVLGSNPSVSSPDTTQVKQWLRDAEHLVVVDSFLSETAALADVVLPGSLWAEETGTTTNLEGRVVLREALRHPPVGARRDLDILRALGARLGDPRHTDFADSEAVFNELRRATKGAPADYAGISYARLRRGDELFWPCPSEDHPGTPRVFAERFAHPNGRATFSPVTYRPPAEASDADYPLALTTGRTLVHYLTGNHTRRTDLLVRKVSEPYVEVHPDTAERFGIAGYATLRTRRASLTLKVKLSKKIRPDTLFVPFHWDGDQAANLLTNPALDPVCKMPAFKVCAAMLEPVVTPQPTAVLEPSR